MNASKHTGSSSSTGSVRSGQGRPIGLLVHWLRTQEQHVSRQSHCEQSVPLMYSFEERAAAREFFKSLPDSEKILTKERPQREEDEPTEEPDFIY